MILLVGLLGSCGGEDPGEPSGARTPTEVEVDEDGSAACQAVQQTFIDCELGSLVSNSVLSCAEIDSPGADPCVTRCLAEASCTELSELLCTDTASLALQDCVAVCGRGEALECEVVLPQSWICDGEADCIDGSDEEQDCPPPFECDGGVEYRASARCDGFDDCDDGTDEEGCPPPFECDDGLRLPADWECDGLEDCTSGEDEHSECEVDFECDSGDLVPLLNECDGVEDCPDGSDEHDGCSFFSCEIALPEAFVCDGVAECVDGSDEEAELCEVENFACGDGELVPLAWQCDGEPDCNDGSDEEDCPEPPVFECDDGTEIPAPAECDRFVDCTDVSDEHEQCWYAFACGPAE